MGVVVGVIPSMPCPDAFFQAAQRAMAGHSVPCGVQGSFIPSFLLLHFQVAACAGVDVVHLEDVPASEIEREREIEMGKEDLLKKPENIRCLVFFVRREE